MTIKVEIRYFLKKPSFLSGWEDIREDVHIFSFQTEIQLRLSSLTLLLARNDVDSLREQYNY